MMDDGEQDALDDGHTRSSAQMSPSITSTKAMMPSTAKKSPMQRASPEACKHGVNALTGA